MTELWKPLIYRNEDFGDTYEISNLGSLRNKKSGKIRKLNRNKKGYLFCTISRGRARKISIRMHRAVAENFVKGNKNLPIDHKDGNKLNNRFDNLEFVSSKENLHRAFKLGIYNPYKLKDGAADEIKALRSIGVKLKDISKIYDISIRTVSDILSDKTHFLRKSK